MFSWLSLAIQVLKVLNTIFNWARERSLMNEGYENALADEAKKTLAMTQRGRALLKKVEALDEKTVDAELRKLEPPAG